MGDRIRYTLDENQIPKSWYNIAADFPTPMPAVLHPGTHAPVGPSDLEPLFPWLDWGVAAALAEHKAEAKTAA